MEKVPMTAGGYQTLDDELKRGVIKPSTMN